MAKHVDSPIHIAFGLSYASWFIVPRVILEAMPAEWQQQFIDLMDELHETLDYERECPPLGVFKVDDDGNYVGLPPSHMSQYRRPDFQWLESIRRERCK